METGMISMSGRGPRGVLTLQFLVLAFTALAVSRFAYNLDNDEAFAFGCLTLIGNIVANVILIALLALCFHWISVANTKAPASTNNRSIITAPTIPPSSTTVASMSGSDRQILTRIRQGEPYVIEGRRWERESISIDSDRAIVRLIYALYSAGALKVYVDISFVPDGQRAIVHRAGKLYVELPSIEPRRGNCIDVVRAYYVSNHIAATLPTGQSNEQFVAVSLRFSDQ